MANKSKADPKTVAEILAFLNESAKVAEGEETPEVRKVTIRGEEEIGTGIVRAVVLPRRVNIRKQDLN